MFNCFGMIREKGLNMISKELLSEVLKIDKRLLRIDEIKENYIFFYTMSNVGESENYINIYEFAFKCKEWAKTKKMYINSIYNEFYWDRIEKEYFADIPNKNKSFYADTEVEAIIKACQWILDNKED